MAEPEHTSMHNFAYHPTVASWVQSTALAQLDSASDEVTEQSPDDFYKSALSHTAEIESSQPPADMTSTRQRQQTANGTARSTPKPSVRSASGPATSTTSTPRSAPGLPSNRPTVRSLAQKFNQPSSAESSPSSSRARPVRPVQTPSSSSPARPAKEASYGTYKFNNLKPRERPQPAPPSPANMRRANGARRPSLEQQASPSRTKIATPSRATGRQPFFGEVIGEHDASTPGFGIPTLEGSQQDANSLSSPPSGNSTIKIVTEDLHSSPTHSRPEAVSPNHQRSASDLTAQTASPVSDSRTPRRRSPPSRIPVASRRMSAASNSSNSSTRSLKYNGARPVGYNRTSPTRQARAPIGRVGTSPKKSKAPAQPTLPAVSYRGYRERGKSPQGANSGPSVAAVITAPLPPTSPRLRNSRERQMLQESPGSRSRSADPHASQDYFGNGTASTPQHQPGMTDAEHTDDRLSVKHVDAAIGNDDAVAKPSPQPELAVNGPDSSAAPAHPQSLSISTDGLHAQPTGQPSSTATSFEYEESPILGMPGSFMMTPPMAQHTPPMESRPMEPQKAQAPPGAFPEGELLQARTFQPATKGRALEPPSTGDGQEAPSELGIRESIPIMLGSEAPHAGWNAPATLSTQSPRLSIGAQRWRAEPLDSTGTISYLEEDDSPIDPFSHRDTLRPDDSASVAFYRQVGQRSPNWTPQLPQLPNIPDAGSFTLDSEAYSVINKVLNIYHQSEVITPEMAQDSRDQVQNVSPIIAQHKDWGSKEATETYLARLLSDAAGSEERTPDEEPVVPEQTSPVAKKAIPAFSFRELEEDPDEPITGGTAIIFPSESRRYSRGSNGSGRSTTTTIWEGPSRPDSSSGLSARERAYGNSSGSLAHAPHPPPKDWSQAQMQLPEIAGAGEGLGLSLQSGMQQQHQQFQTQQPAPPRPAYSPPPPPTMDALATRVLNRSRHGHLMHDYSGHEPLLTPTSEGQLAYDGDHPAHNGPEATPTAAPLPDSALESALEQVPSIITVDDEQPNAETIPGAENNDQQPQLDESTRLVHKRYRVIEELTKTEHSFCVDMMVAHQIFEGTSKEVLNDQERRLLFSNCKDLENFSHGLWKSLKECIKPIVNQVPPSENSEEPYDEFLCATPDNDRLVNVGAIMMAATPRMERVYTTYYLNYGDASDFIKKNANNPELLGWVMACFQHCPNLTSAWDLDSLLIKPVQRMLRYPLLLDDLISKTSPNHPDLPQLKAASETIKKIAERIELAKKRQQTLRAATSEGKKQKKKGLGDRFGKSIVKAVISNKDRAKTMQEAAQVFEDQEYNQVTQKFGGHFFQIQIVIRDFDQYLDAITEQMLQLNQVMLGFITVSETGPSANAEMESTWRRWAMAYLDLQNKALDEHKTAVRNRVMKPICEVWDQWVSPQKLMEQRKKALLSYAKYKQATDRKEKVDPKLDEAAKDFLTINDSLKQELPMLYELTKKIIRICEIIFLGISKDWYKTCSKKILPLLESEPQHTTSITYDFKVYVDRFKSDFRQMEDRARSMAIVNHELMNNIANFTSPNPTFYSDDGSSRKSSSRRTESVGSEMSMIDHRNRNSGGYGSRSGMRSFEGPPRSSPATPYAPGAYVGPISAGPSSARDRAISPVSQTSDGTITQGRTTGRPAAPWSNLDGAFEDTYAVPASIGASFLNPMIRTPTSGSQPSSSRTSGVFNSALPMSDSPARPSADELPPTPGDPDEPEVLFLAASLFEFNIAHDRREGGIPYLVYVPGEIFDVIGMKGELWLARNQDDPTRTVGWIWEKHFARILPEDA